MPWNDNNYPPSLKNFSPRVRGKAVEIANALLEDEYSEEGAIAIATAQAKDWATRRGIPIMDDDGADDYTPNADDSNLSDDPVHVIPHPQGWAVCRPDALRPSAVYDTKQEAIEDAHELAERGKVDLVVHRDDGSIEHHIAPPGSSS